MKRFMSIFLLSVLIAPQPSLAGVSKNPYNRRAQAPVVQKIPVLTTVKVKREIVPAPRKFKGNDPTVTWQAYSYP